MNLFAPAPRPGPTTPISLYVHVPFCATKCPYCDFNTYAHIESLVPNYLSAVQTELRTWATILDRPRVATVFFGGGTPSYLPSGGLARLTDTVRSCYDVAPGAEVTAEANPDDCAPERLASIRDAGVNRLSIGVQSLDDQLLKVLGRRHDSGQAVGAFVAARTAGFTNISIDLMFGLPGQTLAHWTATLDRTMEFAPDHVSMYALTVAPNTPFASDIDSGRIPEPDGDLAADMYELAADRMAGLGYRHYEISNWARPGEESRHNLAYWRNDQYLGVGPGAHSYLGKRRFADVKSPREYVRRASALNSSTRGSIESMRASGVVENVEEISDSLEMAETMMMGLRLDEGIGCQAFEDRFGCALEATYGREIQELRGLGLVDFDDRGLRLTPRGRLLGNEVFQRFMLDPRPA